MRSRGIIFLLLFILAGPGCEKSNDQPVSEFERTQGIRLAWDFSSLLRVAPLGNRYHAFYPRMIQLQDKSLMCIYEVDGDIELLKRSDDGATWSRPLILAEGRNGISRAVPELLELFNGTLLASYNLRPPHDNSDPTRKFGIALKLSEDGGATWSSENIIYEADYTFENGCWEPAQIQLPSGEVQLYFANESPYRSSNEQEISMVRSFDNGQTWSELETVSFRENYRDGMPVPLLLNDNQTILMSIEDNGWDGNFKPFIIKTDVAQNWSNAPVSGTSSDRVKAVYYSEKPDIYSGAPYIRQLSTDEIILSYQTNENRNVAWDYSTMTVCINQENSLSFNRPTVPFDLSPDQRAMWNSLSTVNDKVWALTSTSAYNLFARTYIMAIQARVIPELELAQKGIVVDGVVDADEWDKPLPLFIGHKGITQAKIGLAESDGSLVFGVVVKDQDVALHNAGMEEKNGVKLYIDMNGLPNPEINGQVYAITISADGGYAMEQGDQGNYIPVETSGITVKHHLTNEGYEFELLISNEIINLTDRGGQFGFCAVLNAVDEPGGADTYMEFVSGTDPSDPVTWLPVY